MPEYLAPGVYVEETSFRAKSIEGVSTSTSAFVGPTRKGPFRVGLDDSSTPELLTSYGDFERIYGGFSDLEYGTNFLAHAARAYFNEGGSRLYVARVPGNGAALAGVDVTPPATPAVSQVRFTARFPGAAGNGIIVVREALAPASLVVMNNAPPGTLLRTEAGTPPVVVYHVKRGSDWRPATDPNDPAADPADLAQANPRIVTLTVTARDGDRRRPDEDHKEIVYDDLGFDRTHPRWVAHVLAAMPSRRADQLQNLYAITIGADVTGLALRDALLTGATANPQGDLVREIVLDGGSDGGVPGAAQYALALGQIASLEDVSIVAAPGSSAYPDAQAINGALIAHAEARRAYRIAVLDTPANQTPGQARILRGQMDSRYAALYYPWVIISNPLARPGREDIPREIPLPPSGFVCGIYARNDVERGVHKAPANEVVRSALRFEIDVNFGQQEMLNPLGVNCLRLLSGRGYRVWGARLISSDPEWKYVSDRRYLNYLEASIDRGTQWAVFEPNGERLWANVRQTISDFLYNEWTNGRLLGTTQEEAFFVRCDRSTMTQNDLDNGRLVCLIGVAIIKPAEFVIFRIGQKTADARA
jgi:Bacteriophage tail sheath protein